MKRHQLLAHLKLHGCSLLREGSRHAIVVNHAIQQTTTVPRHNDIVDLLALKKCKEKTLELLPLNDATPVRRQRVLPLLLLILLLIHTQASALSVAPDRPYARNQSGDLGSRYMMDLVLDASAGTLAGVERVTYVNTTGEQQTEIPFRLYPNADYYGEGQLRIERVRVTGELTMPAFTAQDTVMTVPLAEPLQPGAEIEIAIRFTTVVPSNSTGTFGIFSRDIERGTWILADWYPILAGWEAGEGWQLDPPTVYGDPTFSETASYDIRLTAPEGWEVVATGTERISSSANGDARWRIETGPVREFTMMLDDDFTAISQIVDETEVTVYTEGDGRADAGAAIALREAAVSLAHYNDAYGAYPFSELDLVETEMAGALGVSWSGLIFLNGEALLSSAYYVDQAPGRLAFTVAHEVGHQWWGGMVGINSNDHTFLLEGLTNYLAVVAIEATAGEAAAAEQLNAQCVQPYLNALEQYGDGIADGPITIPRDGPPLGALTYGKAALGFFAIRQTIGDDAFFTALRAWAEQFRYGIAGPEDLLAAFETTSDAELDELWRFWFLAAETTSVDVFALVSA